MKWDKNSPHYDKNKNDIKLKAEKERQKMMQDYVYTPAIILLVAICAFNIYTSVTGKDNIKNNIPAQKTEDESYEISGDKNIIDNATNESIADEEKDTNDVSKASKIIEKGQIGEAASKSPITQTDITEPNSLGILKDDVNDYTLFTDQIASFAAKNNIFYSRSNDYIRLEIDDDTSEEFYNTYIESSDAGALKDYAISMMSQDEDVRSHVSKKDVEGIELKAFTINENNSNYITMLKYNNNTIRYYIYSPIFSDEKYYTAIIITDKTGKKDINDLLRIGGITK